MISAFSFVLGMFFVSVIFAGVEFIGTRFKFYSNPKDLKAHNWSTVAALVLTATIAVVCFLNPGKYDFYFSDYGLNSSSNK